MEDDQVDVDDIEAFINGLQTSIDSLADASPDETTGFQARLAKAISSLRVKKMSKIEPMPERIRKLSKEEAKNFLINKLEFLKDTLDEDITNSTRRFSLLMKIAKLREKISRF